MKIQLPAEVYNEIVRTLATRPYAEVYRLMAELDRQRVVIEDEPPIETAPVDLAARRKR